MFVTFSVLKLLTSRLVRELQPLNIALMFVTPLVTKLPRSMEVRLRQVRNIAYILVIAEVSISSLSSVFKLDLFELIASELTG